MKGKCYIKRWSSYLEVIKWGVIVILFAVIASLSYLYSNCNVFLLVFFVLFICVFIIKLFFTTNAYRVIIDFIYSSKAELRQVVWPTRQETLQSTLVVFIITVLISIVLWGLDAILVYLISIILRL